MERASLIKQVKSWLDNVPRTNIVDYFYDSTLAENVLYFNDLEEIRKTREDFEKLSADKEMTARLIAISLDKKRTHASDLSDDGVPINSLEHKADLDFSRTRDKVFVEFLNFVQELVCLCYSESESELSAELNKFIKEIFDFIQLIFENAKSLASMLPIKQMMYCLNPYVLSESEEDDCEIEAFDDYARTLKLDDALFSADHNLDHKKLDRYNEFLSSKSADH